MGEARDVTITAEQFTAAAGPALGVLLPVLGFSPAPFPLPSIFQTGNILPLYLGSGGRRSVTTFPMSAYVKAGFNLSTNDAVRPAVAKPCQQQPQPCGSALMAQLFPTSAASAFSVPSALSQPPPALFLDQLLG